MQLAALSKLVVSKATAMKFLSSHRRRKPKGVDVEFMPEDYNGPINIAAAPSGPPPSSTPTPRGGGIMSTPRCRRPGLESVRVATLDRIFGEQWKTAGNQISQTD